ncbi:MAG: hypothetical protein GX233_00755 [Erysipelothrix sp.]|nr:hypothetical protein [Erysipelothrix sp.]
MKKKDPVQFNRLVYMSMGVMALIIMDITLYSEGGWPLPRVAMTLIQLALVVKIIGGFIKMSKENKK